MVNLPNKIRIHEVGPRDGLQNEALHIETSDKIKFINLLSETGLDSIEVTSFVSPKRVPQLADGQAVFQGIHKKPNIHYCVLVPNEKGAETALKLNVKDIAVFTAVSETFSQKNTECSIAESLERVKKIMEIAKPNHIRVRGYISCVLGCPYEGEMPFSKTVELSEKLLELGCFEISLGDTIGVGTPKRAKALCQEVAKSVPISQLAVHFHDTYGQALANIYACLELGVTTIDSSVGGLGGCPYARGATGNVATEDVLYMLNGLGIETGVDLEKLLNVSRFVQEIIKKPLRSKTAEAKLK